MRVSILSALTFAWLCFGLHHDAATSHTQLPKRQATNSSDACAKLSSQATTYSTTHPSAQQVPFMPSVVLDCFRDIPINETLSVALIDWMQSFVQFQTTLSWLKNPPPSYLRPAVDVVQSLNDISQRVATGFYTNEFDFEIAILTAINSAADLHFSFQPYLPAALSYGACDRGAPLVSVSSNGQDMPEIYFLTDIEAAALPNASFVPSAVTSIDGQDPSTLMDHISQYNFPFTDQDASYNALFPNPAPLVVDDTGLFNAGFDPTMNDTTTYNFANGSQITINNTISLPLLGTFSSGQELYTALLLPPTATASASQASSQTSTQTSTAAATTSTSLQPLYPGFPTPVVVQSAAPTNQAISGYFLPQSDVAVLSITSFDYFGIQDDPAFQTVVSSFLEMCKSSHKTSLIIDIRRNLGGQPSLAWDLFKQLFPGTVPFTRIRTRANAVTDALGSLISQAQTGPPPGLNSSLQESLTKSNTSFFNYHTLLKSPDGPAYTSWDEFFGPVTSHNDTFTNTASFLLSDPSYTEAQFNMVTSGYANLSSLPPSPFSPTQITLLSDALCSSACATFARLMVSQGIRSISAGGRPSANTSTSSMALIGGTQGAWEIPYSDITAFAQAAIAIGQATNTSSTSSTSSPSDTSSTSVIELLSPLTSPRPLLTTPLGTSSVNIYDNLGEGDESLTPLQFTRWTADCRMWYMPRDMVDVQYTWVRVARGVEAGGEGLCVWGNLTGGGGVGNGDGSGIFTGGSVGLAGLVGVSGWMMGFLVACLSAVVLG